MANKVTGTTDTSGGLTTIPASAKSVLVVAPVSGTQSTQIEANTMFAITGTADATAAFGNTSIASDIVRVLISGGVSNIKGIIVGTDEGSIVKALEVSLQDKTIKCIITADNSADTISALKDHLVVAESNDLFRYASIAPNKDDTVDQMKLSEFAKTIDSDRIFVPGPSLSYRGVDADPQVIAAGIVAIIMTETSDPSLPLNGVIIKGFSSLSRIMLDSEMKALASAGVTAIYGDGSTPAIWRLVTSKQNDEVWQEGTTRFTADYVLETVETMLRSKYKRTKNVSRILESIRSDIRIELEKLNSLEIIENFDPNTITVSNDPNDMHGALVDYEFDVITPLYTITINQHMKL